MMRRRMVLTFLTVLMTGILTGCGNNSGGGAQTTTAPETTVAETTTPEETTAKQAAGKAMLEQGNPLEINLAEIVEKDSNAWIKISTQFDPELSMYSYDSVSAGTAGIMVDFTVEDMDVDSATLYWCYQLTSGEKSISVWDTTSPAEQLTITGDGRYVMVFDANVALGGALDEIESLQIVFPGLSEDTSTVFEVNEARYLSSTEDMSVYVTGKVE